MVERRIAHYEVLDEIGAGGMGVVYRARDTRLDRYAAIKALPAELAQDPERLARFEREAKLLASLRNPHIATVYGLEEVDGRRFLAMELVEGQSLAERLSKGPIPVKLALELARQIAEALEAAHQAEVIHRDVKPGNIMIGEDDKAKVLDFGLAKALTTQGPEVDLSLSPTLPHPMTQAGQVLGTPVYMSPEQVEGKEAGKQSDIWAFGCVLYEMLAGKRAFASPVLGDSEVEPDWQDLQPETPLLVRSLLRRCLKKEPRHRLHDMADARIELSEACAGPGREGLQPETAPLAGSTTRSQWSLWLLVSAAAALVGGLLLGRWLAPEAESPTRHFEILSEDLQPLSPGGARMIAISPDGLRIAFVDRGRLSVRDLTSGETRPVPESSLGTAPFFSPDGEWLVYTLGASGMARKTWLKGGESFMLCSARASALRGGSWAEDDRVVLSDGQSLRIVDGDDAACRPFGEEHRDPAHAYRDPQFLPKGDGLLVELVESGGTSASTRSIARLSPTSGELLDVIVKDAGSPRYVATGHLTFLRGSTVFAVQFDPRTGKTSGEPVPVIQDVDFAVHAQMDVSSDGTMIYVPAKAEPELGLAWVDRAGREEPLSFPPASHWAPRLSPDGNRLAVSVRRPGGYDLFILDLRRSTRDLFARNAVWPAWISDQTRLAFVGTSEPPSRLMWQALRGSSPAEPIGPPTDFGHYVLSASTDPTVFTFYETRTEGGRDILVMRPGEEPVSVVATPGEDKAPRLSPDARFLAYASDTSGRDEIYVRTCPPCRPDLDLPEQRWRLSPSGGTAPIWSRDGSEIFYLEGHRMMAVAVRTDPAFEADPPELLFESDHIRDQFDNPNYDVAADGRFIMIRGDSNAASRHRINVVVNWSKELRRHFR